LFSCLLTMTTRHSRWIYMDPGASTGHASPARSDRPLFPSRSKRQMVSIAVNLMVPPPFLQPSNNVTPGCPHTMCVRTSQSISVSGEVSGILSSSPCGLQEFSFVYVFISLLRFFPVLFLFRSFFPT